MMTTIKSKLSDIYTIQHGRHSTINAIEGLRAIAAFMVFVVHYAAQFTPWIDTHSLTWELIVYYRHIGAKGVELFFVISGFLIYGIIIGKDTPFVTYFWRRIVRLYPVFLVVLALYIALSFIFSSENKIPDGIGQATLYIISNILMLPGLFDIKPIITVAWSLSYEMFLYLALPVFVYVLQMRSWESETRIRFLAVLSILGFVVIYAGYDSHQKMVLFLAGMLMYELKNRPLLQSDNPLSSNAFILTILAIIIIRIFSLDSVLLLPALFIGFFFTFASCLNKNSKFSQLCSTPFLRYYGNMSYSYYLIHGITLKFFFMVMAVFIPPNHQWDLALYVWFLPAFAFTWVTSTVLFLLVEKPYSLMKKSAYNKGKKSTKAI